MGRALLPQCLLIMPSPGESVGLRARVHETKAKSKQEACSKVASYVASHARCRMDGINKKCVGNVPELWSKGRCPHENMTPSK